MQTDYSIRELTTEEFKPLFEQHVKNVFASDHSYDWSSVLSLIEKENIESLRKNLGSPYRLNLGVFDAKNQFVGWSWGQQENASTFYMVNSAVLPEHRQKGLYNALLKKCIELLSQKGFQLLYSRHCATNNSIIIPKLKAGFVISKMEVDDKFGVLIHLHFYTNTDRRQVMDYRSGQAAPNEKIKKLFNI